MANYNNTSPWFTTSQQGNYLNHLSIRSVSAEPDDKLITVSPAYHQRPDLLAFDLYGTAKLWWVFAQRNMDIIRDPIFDFTAGTSIYVPKKSSLFRVLGI